MRVNKGRTVKFVGVQTDAVAVYIGKVVGLALKTRDVFGGVIAPVWVAHVDFGADSNMGGAVFETHDIFDLEVVA